MSDVTKAEAEAAIGAQAPAVPRKLTRAEVREALTCPICKTPGTYLGEHCRKCGSYQDDSGKWITPTSPPVRKGPKFDPWFDWD